MPTLTSRQNPIVARFRAAARRDSPDVLLLDGAHLVGEALDAGLVLHEVAITAGASPGDEIASLVDRAERRGVTVSVVSSAVMDALSPVRSPSAVVALAERPVHGVADVYGEAPLVVVAVDVQDPGNLGAIVRVAEAGGATGVVCAGVGADPFGWKALRGSMG
ncbi:MAG: TrmH family RNA methyltransferase, partial [Acidobacteriota bacterium]